MPYSEDDKYRIALRDQGKHSQFGPLVRLYQGAGVAFKVAMKSLPAAVTLRQEGRLN